MISKKENTVKRILNLMTQGVTLALATAFFWLGAPIANAQDGVTWSKCANEGSRCEFSGVRAVRYGADGKYVTREFKNGVDCGNPVFGDPIPGFSKSCEVAVAAAAPTPAPGAPNWSKCADEGGRCNFNGVRTVRYGANERFVTREFKNGVDCGNQVFGDPIPGLSKSCEVAVAAAAPTPAPGAPSWSKCADEGGRCNFNGVRTMRYGANDRFVTREFKNGVDCGNPVFGDPIPGFSKSCEVAVAAAAPAPAPAPGAPSWSKCADEGGRCNFNGVRTVRYGANDRFVTREFKNGVDCGNPVFGDPIPGLSKYCEVASATVAAPVPPPGGQGWSKCADEGGRCNFNGVRIVRYGAKDQYNTREFKNGVDCNNQVFGDPIEGVSKQCEIAAPGQAAWVGCAKEGETCNFTGLRQVRYGARGKFTAPRNMSKAVECSNAVFGDPAPGMSKNCEYGPEIPITWTQCATEGGNCNFNGMRVVRYGARERYAIGEFFNGVACTNAVFGDPIRGTSKRCEYGPEVDVNWNLCANEGEQCNFNGTNQVRYGSDGKFAVREATNGTACNNQVFGDPNPGVSKRCELGPRVR
jgi:hypothetical protein